ncbi:TonB-dependent receptor domain-containing protein [Pedobacter steynii]|uniref:Outer membrane receptor proteins, mostly Fe transport n=1 Tax=Pedobacter steynii TaxID=430522 RepID=A0A1D7QKZ5_9SPHI|nr:TonB-dependent receptor [Pedobacter steynii]AOM79351.1 hypothetical protein BFS30_20565 [Pedobacter steynii]
MLTYFLRICFAVFFMLAIHQPFAVAQVPAQPATGKKTSIISGLVVDSATHKPLDFVTLILTSDKGAVIKTAASAQNGTFTFEVANGGNYILNASYMGYRNYTSSAITLKGGGTIDLGRIALHQQPGMLSEVTVAGKKALIQNKGDKIIYNASSDVSNKSGSASDVFRKAPMVTVDADGGIKMRGSSNIKVLLNGLPSTILAKNLKEALKTIPASSIESIEVITTPSAKYEAEGAAGVINIVTKKKMQGTSGNVDISGGNLEQSAAAGLNVAAGKFNFNLSLNSNRERNRSLSELSRQTIFEGQQIGNLFQRNESVTRSKGAYGNFSTEFRPDSTQKIGATVSLWHGSWPVESKLYNLYNSPQGTSEYNQNSNQDGKFTTFDLSLNYQKKFRQVGQELSLIGQYSPSNDQSDYLTQQYLPTGQRSFRETSPNRGSGNDKSLQADYVHPLGNAGKNIVETGVRYSRTQSKSAYSVFNNRNNPSSVDLTEDPSRSDTMNYFQNIFAGYFSVKFETKNHWAFRSGLRYESTNLGGSFQGPIPSFKAKFGNFVPSMLITKKLGEFHELKLNYTERIRRPWIWDLNPYVNASDPRNLTYGNPNLRPEITRMLEAGYGYTSASGFSLNSSVYFNSNRNAIESLSTLDSLGISRTTSRNIAANRRLGTNVFTSLQLNPNWSLSAGAEFYHVWFESKALNVKNDANFYSFNFNTAYVFSSGYTIQASGDYSNGYVTLQGRSSANYTYRFSARKELLNKKASVTLGINNPFQNRFLQKSFTSASTFNSTSNSWHYNRSFSLALSYRFGSMQAAPDYSKGNHEQGAQPVRRGRGN